MFFAFLFSILFQSPSFAASNSDCNFWRIGWCYEHYSNEYTRIFNITLPGLAKQQEDLLVELSYSSQGIAVAEGQWRSAVTELESKSAQLASDIELKQILEWSLALARESTQKLNPSDNGIVLGVKKILELFSNHLTKSARITKEEIEIQLKRNLDESLSNNHPEVLRALIFERTHLETLKSFAARCKDNAELARELENLSQSQSPETSPVFLGGLSPETLAILQQSKELMTHLSGFSEKTVPEVRTNLSKIQEKLETAYGRIQNSIEEKSARVQSLPGVIAELYNGITKAREYDDRTQRDYRASLADSVRWRSRILNTELYKTCCDDKPHCTHLPDYNQQDEWDYAAFESSISPIYHKDGCERSKYKP